MFALRGRCRRRSATRLTRRNILGQSIYGYRIWQVQEAECYSSDKAPLLAAIETGFSSLDDFNRVCSESLLKALSRGAEGLETDTKAADGRAVVAPASGLAVPVESSLEA